MKKMFFLALILFFLCASSATAGQVVAKISNKCFPQNGYVTVPAGKSAVGFKVLGLSNGTKCRGGGSPNCKGWGIKSSNNSRIYNWSQCRSNKPYESKPLSTLVLGPGKYLVYVDGGKGANVTVAYTIK
jgi:hypothetical protein